MSTEVLWPARNVAQYAYCPRLFYFMQIEGVFLPSSDTEKGLAIHRRVNRPSAARDRQDDAETAPDGPKKVRSLALTSNRLALTAVLDLTELEGQKAVPVEYRKGKPSYLACEESPDQTCDSDRPHDTNADPTAKPPPPAPRAWPTDRVQVGLQALLLEEAGYEVNKAVLYYAAKKLRLEIPVDEKLKSEALTALAAAKALAEGSRPPPLVNDPRCPRCSLQPICLPDEINHQRAAAKGSADGSPLKRMWPPRDDGIHVVALSNGVKVGIRGQALRVTDRHGATTKTMPLVNVESVSLLGYVQISTQALHTLAELKIPVAFLSSAGRLAAMVDPLDSVSAHVRIAQVKRLTEPDSRLELARALITAKITNQRTLLMRNHDSLPEGVASELARLADQAAKAKSLETLLGYEGHAASVYFKHFPRMLKTPLAAEFSANGRRRRPPPDPINSCLSLAYSILSSECIAALRLARLEPTIGGMHTILRRQPALALDLMEPFRPLIGDSIAISAFNRGELTEGHFLRAPTECTLTTSGWDAFFDAYSRRMRAEVTHPVFQYKLSYRRMIRLHALMIAAWLVGDVPNLAFLTTR